MTYSDLFDNPTQETLFTVRFSSFEDGGEFGTRGVVERIKKGF